MNKIHSKVWNKELGQLVVASEFASSDSAGVVHGAGEGRLLRGSLLAALIVPLLGLAGLGSAAFAQEWTVTDGTSPAVIGDGGTVTFQGDSNISVEQTGADGAAVLAITLDPDLVVDSVTTGATVMNNSGVAVGANVMLGSTGLVINGGPSVTIAGINAGNNVITGVAAGTAADHAVNFGQFDAVSTALDVAEGTLSDHATAIATNADNIATNAGNIATNADEIEAVRATASAGWDISAEGGATANVGSAGAVDFSGDGNIEVARTGTDLSFSLADEIAVDSVSVGGMTLDVDGIDAGGKRITGLADGNIALNSTDAVTGHQLHQSLFEGGTAFGVRYFRANSSAPDSQALGAESVAIGPSTVAEGLSSFAAGDGAATTATAEGAIALGQGATAGTEGGAVDDGAGSIAIGRDSRAAGNSTMAMGDGASVENERVSDALAVGSQARVSGMDSHSAIAAGHGAHASAANATAVGAGAHAGGVSATALGNNANATGGSSIAIGQARANAGNGIAAGAGAYVGTANSIALGTGAGIGTEDNAAGDRTDHIAIGTGSGQAVVGNQNTAMGYNAGNGVIGDQNVAIGPEAGRGLAGNNNISIGVNANDGAGARAQAIAVGDGTRAGSDSVALGSGARAVGSETLALGKDSSAGSNGVAVGAHTTAEGANIALGRNSAARASDVTGSGYLTGSVAPGTAVSVGNSNPGEAFQRRIINVADGAQGYDAVNVRQLQGAQQSVANLVGGGVGLNADGSFSPITVQDTDGNDITFNTIVEAIGAVTDGTVEILPADAVQYNADGTITVAAGKAAGQAVNVEQLDQAIEESGVKYFSANSTEIANRNNDGATGTDAMAIGPSAVAAGNSSLAIGNAARVNADAHSGVALGYDVSARAENATVLGNRSHTYDQAGVAIGHQAVSRGQNSIVMGTSAEADPKSGGTVDNAIVIGTNAEATADDGIAIGQSALASEVRAVAQGFDAHAVADDAQAFGTRSRASGVSSQARGTEAAASGANAQASGTRAQASGLNAIASGTDARGYASDGIAMGTGAVSGAATTLPEETYRNINGIAIGNSALSDNRNALALGVEARSRAESSTAIGDGAVATEDAEDGLAVGSGARVTAQNASAFGQGSEAVAAEALAVGSGARASAEGASAFGQGAQAAHAGSVALGSNAVTAAAVGTSSLVVDKNTYNFAGTAPVATVSVGAPGAERTITNVAAGRISATSTDAINGSQLHGTNMALEALAGNLDTAGGSVANVLGGNASYDPVTHEVTMTNVGGTGEDTVHDAIEYAAQGWDVSAEGGAAANVAPGGAVDFSSSDGNIDISRAGTNLEFALADDLVIGNSITVGDTVINGDSITTNNLTVEGETRLGDNFVVHSDGDVTYNGSEVATRDDGLAFAGNTGGTISKTLGDGSPLTVSGGLGAGEASTGANLRVDSDGNQLNLVMARDLTDLDSITINSGGPVITAGGINMGGNQITNLAAGTADDHAVNLGQLNDVEALANAGWSVRAQGQNATNVGVNSPTGNIVDLNNADDNIVITKADDSNDVTFDLAENIDLGADGSLTTGNTVVDTTGVAVDDGAGNLASLTVNGTSVADAAGNTTAVGAGTVAVTDANGTTTIGGSQIVVDGGNPVTIDGGAGMISGLANTTFDPDEVYTGGVAATQEQLSQVNGDLTSAGLNFVGDDALNVHRDLGETLSITGGADPAALSSDNIGVTRNVDEDGLVIELADNIELTEDGSLAIGDGTDGSTLDAGGLDVVDGSSATTVGAGTISVTDAGNTTTIGGSVVSVGGANPIVVSGDTGTVGGLQNQAIDYPEFADGSGRAATEEQLDLVNQTANAGWNLSGSGAGTVNIGPDGAVDFQGDQNIGVAQTGVAQDGVIEITLNRDLDVDTVTAGDTSVDTTGVAVGTDVHLGDTGLVITGGPSVTAGGIDAGGTVITNVAPGVDGTDAVNVDQLTGLANTPLTFAGDAGTDVDRLLGETVNLVGGATDETALTDGNIGVVADGTDTLEIKLNKDVDLGADGSVAIGDTTVDNDGLAIDDGAGNVTTVTADGTTVTDAAGNTTAVGAGTVAVTDAAGTTTIGGSHVSVGGANPIVISGDAGTIGGLTNTTFDPDNFTSGQAATEDQLRQVSDVANAGWNVSVAGEGAMADNNVGPGGTVDFSNTDGNIVIDRNGTDLAFDLADDVVVGNSVTVGDTYIDTTGVAIGADVHLGSTGLVITGGPSVTVTGINAGNMVITNVAPGEVSATSTDAINGSQLHGMGDSLVTVIGGNAELNPDGTIVTSDIGGTGHDNIDDAIRAANDAANAGWTATDAGGNAANIGPNGTVNFTGDGNISVAQTGTDGSGEIEITLNRDLDVDSITAGDTVIDTDGVRVGDDVHLGDTGLVIEGGPSVTIDGIDAGGQVISNVAAGVEDTDAANVGQLRQVAADVVDLGDRMDVVEGDVSDLQAGATGPFQVSQEAPMVAPTPTGANSAAGGSGADASGDNATALGNQAVASGANSTAVGQGAQATHDNSVALGQGSATTVGAQSGYDAAYVGSSDSAGEVNVGNRTVSGVAPGVAGTDAVNVNQLRGGVNHAVVTANAYTDQRFNQVQNDVWHLQGRVDELERDINSGVATAMALRQAPYVAGATTYYAGFGAYKGEGALGVSLRRTADNGRWSLEGGFSANRDGAGGYIGVSGVLGSK